MKRSNEEQDIREQLDHPPVPRPDSVKWEFARRIAPDLEPFWVADMDFPTAEPVRAAVSERANHGLLGYTFAQEAVFEAFSEWQRTRMGVVPSQHRAWLPGVMAGVRAAVSEFTSTGERVIVQTPVYFPFMDAVCGQGRELALNTLVHDGLRYRIDFENLEEQMRAGARLLLFCSPQNPVGRVWERDELTRLARLCSEYDVLLVSDEIHADLLLPGRRFVPTAAVADERLRLITLSSATKSFNIPGLPGAIASASDDKLLDPIRARLHSVGADIPNVLTLAAVEAAYRAGGPWLDTVMAYIGENDAAVRRVFAESDGRITIEPLEGTYLLWLGCHSVSLDDVSLRSTLQKEANAWLVEGSKFGDAGAGYLRMNIAAPKSRVVAAARRIARVMEQQQ